MTENYLDILARTIRENWDQPALTDFYLTEDGTAQDTSRGNCYTYGQMYGEMMRLGELFRLLGLKKGDHIAICGGNSANWAVAYLAIAACQGVAVTVLHSQNIEDIAGQIDFSDNIALFTDKELWEELRHQNLPQIKYVIALDDFGLIAGDDPSDCTDTIGIPNGYNKDNITIPHGEPDDLAMICFTSGSSGASKGVMLSYRNISYTIAYQVDYLKRFKRKNTISLLPLGHIYGCIDEFVRNMYIGTHVYILKNISTPKKIVQSYQIIQPSYVALVPFLLQYFMLLFGEKSNTNSINSFFGNRIEKVFVAAAALSPKEEEKLLSIGLPLLKGYGTTECSPSIANSITCENMVGSVGKAVAQTQINISPEGEILVKGENVMLGYYKNPEATAQKIDKDGWLHTGDKGYMDEDGYLYVTGRIGQDMIVLPNGENIHPEDIENKINALPEVQESIVLARDGKLVAIVRPTDLSQNTPNTLNNPTEIRHTILRTVNPQLPGFSQLYDVEFIDQPLARTAKQTIKRYLYK